MMSASSSPRHSIVFHADDFGMNAAVNAGIEAAFREGLLTSTSLLANAPAAEDACRVWPALMADVQTRRLSSLERRHMLSDPLIPFDLGIHLNLTQGRPLTSNDFSPELLDEEGCFPGIGKLFARINHASDAQMKSVEAELRAQIEWMIARGHHPTHLNGHQYIELIPRIAAIVPALLHDYAIPTVRVACERGLFRSVLLQGDVTGWGLGLVKRHFARAFRRRMANTNVAFPDRFFGTSHAGRIDDATMTRFLASARGTRMTEIGVHPAIDPGPDTPAESDPWFDPLAEFRSKELKLLCSSKLAEELRSRQFSLGRLSALATETWATEAT
ncbi:carbohydrate deacetylase [Schlesneria sp. T3-172]|uniref:carbohydrate deacetylase n=1 Tax=Schlesneria sphaerica TaxID=3373610 RepID=UPI0037C64988